MDRKRLFNGKSSSVLYIARRYYLACKKTQNQITPKNSTVLFRGGRNLFSLVRLRYELVNLIVYTYAVFLFKIVTNSPPDISPLLLSFTPLHLEKSLWQRGLISDLPDLKLITLHMWAKGICWGPLWARHRSGLRCRIASLNLPIRGGWNARV